MEYIRYILSACGSIWNYSIYLGGGYYISLSNVVIYGLIGVIILRIFYKLYF